MPINASSTALVRDVQRESALVQTTLMLLNLALSGHFSYNATLPVSMRLLCFPYWLIALLS